MSCIRQRKGRHHLHGLTVRDFSEVFSTLTVGYHSDAEFARSLRSSLPVMFVEMDTNLVRSKLSLIHISEPTRR